MSSTRQLAAILFADIVGYTGMMQEDENEALQSLQKFRFKLEMEVSRHEGRILELRGDGALCSFKSTLEGVRAALAVQLEMQMNPQVPVRMGLHTGDVMIDGDSIYGDGVNIASRLESFAIPGSIFISGRVHDDIKNQKDIPTLSLGKFTLKNIKEDVAIFAVSHPGIKIPDTSHLEGKGEKAKAGCILVLPFANISHDADQDYFSDGLTEELISNLLRLNEIKVISRTTSMKYKGTVKDIKTISSETGATYIMEGSVRMHGQQLRITAQFIDANTDAHLWANTYNGTLDDIFDIQEKVASKIVEALRIQLTSGEKDSLQKRFTVNSEAYQLYLQGRYFWNKRNEEGLNTSIRFFESAIQKDPEYALAWTGLADAYNLMAEFSSISRRELFPKAKAALHKALEIDSQLAEAYISKGSLLMLNEWDWVNAGIAYKIGLDLNPNYATGHHWYAEWLLFQGHELEARKEIGIAVELDPISKAIIKDEGIIYYYSRLYDIAIEKAQKAIELGPDFDPTYRLRSLCYQGKGMFEKAIEENEEWGKRTGNKSKTKVALAQIYAASGNQEEARKILDEVETNFHLTGNDYRGVALIYASLGEMDSTFEWIEKSINMHEESLISLMVDPKFDSIRSDPRYPDVLKKLGLKARN